MSAAIPPAQPSGTGTLSEADWLRLGQLRPGLRPALQLERQISRGQRWHLVRPPGAAQPIRMNALAWDFAAHCDGQTTLATLLAGLQQRWGAAAPGRDDLVRTLGHLQAQGVLMLPAEAQRVASRWLAQPVRSDGEAAGRARRHRASPLAWPIPLGRPDAWLTRWARWPGWALLARAEPLWWVLVLTGAATAALHADELAAYARTWLSSPRLMLLAWLLFPWLKAGHELAHALTLKRLGGEVPAWGITLMFFTPVPYVDASSAVSLPRRSQRAAVSAAGMRLELALASAALLLALPMAPGGPRDALLVVFFMGGLSTVLVNANPLLRFDGYHLLCDLLDLPNWASRSQRWWLGALRGHALGLPADPADAPAPRERLWLCVHAPLALAWRLALALWLMAWAGQLSVWLGWILAGYLVWHLLLHPAAALAHWGRRLAGQGASGARAARRLAGLVGGLGLLLVLPWPAATVVPGVVWTPDEALVRAGTAGTVQAVWVADGQQVQPGQPLIQLAAPELLPEAARLEGRLAALEAQHLQALSTDPARAAALASEMDAVRAERLRLEDRLQGLWVRAPVAGRVALAQPGDLPGRGVRQGDALAHVLTDPAPRVRVAVPQHLLPQLQAGLPPATVALAEHPAWAPTARWLRAPGAARARLPHAALADRHGGDVVTDPRDPDALTPSSPMATADLQLPPGHPARLGGRAWVRLDLGWSPLAWQALRWLRRQILDQFSPAA